MILFFYNVGLLLALVLGAPWWLWQLMTTRKYREGMRERLGRVPAHLTGTVDSPRSLDVPSHEVVTKPIVWIHAVSVGEVLAITRLVSELDQSLPNYRILISSTTRTGHTLAVQRFGSDRVFYCPLDLPWAVTSYLNALRPKLLVLAETEFWPNLLTACFLRGIPVAVVNARISDRSWPRYRRLRLLWKPFLRRLTILLAQSDHDAERLRALGCLPENVTVSGNLKFDVRALQKTAAVQLLQSLGNQLKFVVAGSTAENEEALLLAAWPKILEQNPNLAMILAPRHPERFPVVADLLAESGLSWRSRSETDSSGPPLSPGEIVLLDSIGELASIYSLAAVAFVGGSLVPAGGHNPLEPAQFAVALVMGSHYANFRAIVEALNVAKGIVIVTADSLPHVIIDLLSDQTSASALGQQARQVFETQAGATARTVDAIRRILVPRKPN